MQEQAISSHRAAGLSKRTLCTGAFLPARTTASLQNVLFLRATEEWRHAGVWPAGPLALMSQRELRSL